MQPPPKYSFKKMYQFLTHFNWKGSFFSAKYFPRNNYFIWWKAEQKIMSELRFVWKEHILHETELSISLRPLYAVLLKPFLLSSSSQTASSFLMSQFSDQYHCMIKNSLFFNGTILFLCLFYQYIPSWVSFGKETHIFVFKEKEVKLAENYFSL